MSKLKSEWAMVKQSRQRRFSTLGLQTSFSSRKFLKDSPHFPYFPFLIQPLPLHLDFVLPIISFTAFVILCKNPKFLSPSFGHIYLNPCLRDISSSPSFDFSFLASLLSKFSLLIGSPISSYKFYSTA